MKWPPIIEGSTQPWWAKLRDIILTVAAWFLLWCLVRDMLTVWAYALLHLFGIEREAPWPFGAVARRLVPFMELVALFVAWLAAFAIARWKLLTNTREAASQPAPLDPSDRDPTFALTLGARDRLNAASIISVRVHDDGTVDAA